MLILLFFATLFLAYANGANDNFKGVATLYGSGTVSYRTAIGIATVATFAGSICAIFLAQGLVATFSGKGLVPQTTAGALDFLMAVGLGAASTVLLATLLGFPISTTHSLVGALVGAGLMAVGMDVNFERLGGAFFVPLLVSPFIALVLAALAYWIFNRTRKTFGLSKETCVCVGERKEYVPVASLAAMTSAESAASGTDLAVTVANDKDCVEMYTDRVWGISLQKLLDLGHGLSGASVSFARGLNDTPKIAGLLVAAQSLSIQWGMVAIALGMAVGGLLNAKRVAETISHKITDINHGQGLAANLVTAFLVIFASKLGVPVSTTHVSVGAIFGIGAVSGKRNTAMIGSILAAWFITLPVALSFSAMAYWLLA
jgi:PiT family inorganic phosphate transporter